MRSVELALPGVGTGTGTATRNLQFLRQRVGEGIFDNTLGSTLHEKPAFRRVFRPHVRTDAHTIELPAARGRRALGAGLVDAQ